MVILDANSLEVTAHSEKRFIVYGQSLEIIDLRDLSMALQTIDKSIRKTAWKRLLGIKNHSSFLLSSIHYEIDSLSPKSKLFIQRILSEIIQGLLASHRRVWTRKLLISETDRVLHSKKIKRTSIYTRLGAEVVGVRRKEAFYRDNYLTLDLSKRFLVFEDGSTLFDGWLPLSEISAVALSEAHSFVSYRQIEEKSKSLVLEYFPFIKGGARQRMIKLIVHFTAETLGIALPLSYVALIPARKHFPDKAESIAKERKSRIKLKREENDRVRASAAIRKRNADLLKREALQREQRERELWLQNSPSVQISELDPAEAEELAAMWMRHLGVRDASKTKNTGDGGFDVDSSTWLAQVKHQNQPVGPAPVRQLQGILFGKRGVFFTKTGYSSGAIAFANRAGIALFVYKNKSLRPHSKVAREVLEAQSLLKF